MSHDCFPVTENMDRNVRTAVQSQAKRRTTKIKRNQKTENKKRMMKKVTPAVKQRQTDKRKTGRVRRKGWEQAKKKGTAFSVLVCFAMKQKVHSSGTTVLPNKSNDRK